MVDIIFVVIIAAIIQIVGIYLSNSKMTAVITDEIKNLQNELAIHNSLARKIPMLEKEIEELAKRVAYLEMTRSRTLYSKEKNE